jgi:excisionase family DNA binding protein
MSICPCGFGHEAPLSRALYSPKETQRILNVSHATCYRLISAGKLDARKLGRKTLITVESIGRLISELPPLQARPACP